MKALLAVLLLVTGGRSQTIDRYPQVRALVLEAEAAAGSIPLLRDRSNPHTWAGDILAHAGYLDDAERAYAKSQGPTQPPYTLWRAWVVYGHRDRAERMIANETSTEKKARYNGMLADLLWRMGESEEARARYEAARVTAMKIADPAVKKRVNAYIDQGFRFVSEPPPEVISATPHPKKARIQDSAIPSFPITASGFQEGDPKENVVQAQSNERFMTQLYSRAAAGDRAGLERLTEGAETPFQKALGFAGLEHILIQMQEPELAEKYANRIPESDSSSALAKAEALTAAGVAWLSSLDQRRAQRDFESAKQIVSSVPDLPLGRISVLIAIAAGQFKAQMPEESGMTFRSSIELAQKLAPRPRVAAGVPRPATKPGVHYRDEAFGMIVRGAIHAGNLQMASEAAESWAKTDGDIGSGLVDAWLAEGHTEEAIAAARRIRDTDSRVTALLHLAQTLLSDAGAPVF